MENLTLEQALIKFNKRTKQQLERTLTAQNFDWSVEGRGKQAVYTINGKKVSEWEKLFGFEPSLPQATAKVLLYIDEKGKVENMFDYDVAEAAGVSRSSYKTIKAELLTSGLMVEETHQYQGGEYFYQVFGKKYTVDEFAKLRASHPTRFVQGVKRVAFKSLSWGFLTEEQKEFLATV